MIPPAEKQLRLAKWITEELYMSNPGFENMSRHEVARFISKYHDAFQKALDKRVTHRNTSRPQNDGTKFNMVGGSILVPIAKRTTVKT